MNTIQEIPGKNQDGDLTLRKQWRIQDRERARQKALFVFAERMTARILQASVEGNERQVNRLLKFKSFVLKNAVGGLV